MQVTAKGVDQLYEAANQITRLDPSIAWEVIVKEKKATRSVCANNLYWHWLKDLEGQLGHTQAEMDAIFLDLYAPKRFVQALNKTVTVLTTTSKMNVSEFTEYLTKIEAWAMNFGCYLTKHNDYNEAMGRK